MLKVISIGYWVNMANQQGSGIPAFYVYYDYSDPDRWLFKVCPINDFAKEFVPVIGYFNTRDYARLLYKVRGIEASEWMLSNLDNTSVKDIVSGKYSSAFAVAV